MAQKKTARSRGAAAPPPQPAAAPPAEIAVEVEPLPPIDVGSAAIEALEAAGRALQAGRVDEAERLSKVAWNIGRMAEKEVFQRPPPERPELEVAEVIIGLERLFSLTETWAEDMLLHGAHRLPAVIVARAALWRAMVLGEEAEQEDQAEAAFSGWLNQVWGPDGEFRPPPTHKRLARFAWGVHEPDFPHPSQLPPG